MKNNISFRILIVCIAILVIQLIASSYSFRVDLTADQRYSLSESTKDFIKSVEQPLRIDVFLSGKLPQDYKRLRTETEVLLQSLESVNDRFYFEFIDPFEGSENTDQLFEEMSGYGLDPELVVQRENQAVEQSYVFPWMMISYEGKSVRVPLLQKNLGDTQEQRILQSIQQLEYAVVDGIFKILLKKKKKIAVLSSHNTSEDILITNFLQDLLPYYNLAAFDLKAIPKNPSKTLENLNRFDLFLVSNPKERFSNTEKFILDQYTQQGGNSLYLIDPVRIDKDSLFSIAGKTVSYGNELDLDELFFKYGFRLRKELVKDLYSAPIVLANGNQNNSQYNPYPWTYHPLSKPNQAHPIGSAVGSVFFRFGSPIDVLKTDLKTTELIKSSPLSKIERIPSIISISEATQPIKPAAFNDTSQTLGLLLEGSFSSLYTNRIKPFKVDVKENKPARMAIFADGNLIENQIDKGQPLELGYDKWTNNFYSNKQFFKNTVHYLIGENKFLDLRTKEVKIAMIDSEIEQGKVQYWRYFSVLAPLFILLIISFIFNRYRLKSYRQ